MKTYYRVAMFIMGFISFLGPVNAQDTVAPMMEKSVNTYNAFELGLRIMPGFSSYDITTSSGHIIKGEPSRGYGYMLVVGCNFSKYIGMETGLGYNTFSKRYKDQNLEREVNIKYMNIPVLLSVSTNKTLPVSFNVVAGPQLGIDAGSNANIVGEEQTDTLNGVFAMKKTDLELVYGAGLDFSFSKLQTLHVGIGFRAAYGLTDINSNQETIKENGYYILDDNKRRTYSGFVLLTYGF